MDTGFVDDVFMDILLCPGFTFTTCTDGEKRQLASIDELHHPPGKRTYWDTRYHDDFLRIHLQGDSKKIDTTLEIYFWD